MSEYNKLITFKYCIDILGKYGIAFHNGNIIMTVIHNVYQNNFTKSQQLINEMAWIEVARILLDVPTKIQTKLGRFNTDIAYTFITHPDAIEYLKYHGMIPSKNK